jgi:hypothetical protein
MGESNQRGADLYGKDKPLSITVNVDPKALDELRTPRLLYLWRGE